MTRQLSYARLESAVRPLVQAGQLEQAIARCEAELAALPRTEYHVALGRSWLRQVQDASNWLVQFYQSVAKVLPVRAIYCEMNRFEINPDEWYLNALSYDFFGGAEDPGWLCGWKNSGIESGYFPLIGMDDLQGLFSRDYSRVPPDKVRTASEVVILLLTLRMQQLVCAAAGEAHQACILPADVPVLAAAHDSDLVCFCYGSVVPPVTRPEPARPAARRPRSDDRLGIYRMDEGYDEFRNSLPWDVLDYASDQDQAAYDNGLKKAEPLAENWVPPRVTLRRRKWRCDLISLYPHWVVNEKARAALAPLLQKNVEFLPLLCPELPQIWVLHPLQHIDLAPDAVHNGTNGSNLTVIRQYAFEVNDLKGKHLFGVKQAAGSAAREAGYCFAADYVSEEFAQLAAVHGLQGVVFDEVLSYRLPEDKVQSGRSRVSGSF